MVTLKMTKLRRFRNAFTLNPTVVSNDIKSSTPVEEKIQNTLRMMQEKAWIG